jgi:hypothetical protein
MFIFGVARTNPDVSTSTGGTGDATENIGLSGAVFRSLGTDETKYGARETRMRTPRRHPETRAL